MKTFTVLTNSNRVYPGVLHAGECSNLTSMITTFRKWQIDGLWVHDRQAGLEGGYFLVRIELVRFAFTSGDKPGEYEAE